MTVTALLTLLTPAWAEDQPGDEAARGGYREGVAAFEQGRFKRSLRLLRRARRRAASPRLVGSIEIYLGINHAVLGDRSRARAAFAAAMRHDATLELDSHRHKPEIVRLFAEIRASLRGYLEITGPGATVTIDGEPAGKTPLRQALGIGRHRVEVRDAAGELLLGREVVVAPERTTKLNATRDKSGADTATKPATVAGWAEGRATPRRRRARRIWTWVAAGGAVIAGAVGIGFGVAALGNHDEYSTTQDPQRFDELSDRIPTQVTVANTMYVVGGLLAAGAVALYFLEGRASPRRRPSRDVTRLPVTPLIGPSGLGVSLERSF